MTPDFFQVFAKSSLIKNIYEHEKKFEVEHDFLVENSSQLSACPRRGLQANQGTVRKVQYSRNQAIKNS